MLHSLVSDLKYAARELRKRLGFTLAAVLSLALGIGATSAVFSIVYAVLINPFPYTGSERIAELSLRDKAGSNRYVGLNGPQIEALRKLSTVESIIAEDGWNLTTTDGDLPEGVMASFLRPMLRTIGALRRFWVAGSCLPTLQPGATRSLWSSSDTGSGSAISAAIRMSWDGRSSWSGSRIKSWA